MQVTLDRCIIYNIRDAFDSIHQSAIAKFKKEGRKNTWDWKKGGTGTGRIGIQPKRQLPFQLEMQRHVTASTLEGLVAFCNVFWSDRLTNLIPLYYTVLRTVSTLFDAICRCFPLSRVYLFPVFPFSLFSSVLFFFFIRIALARKTRRISSSPPGNNGKGRAEEQTRGSSLVTDMMRRSTARLYDTTAQWRSRAIRKRRSSCNLEERRRSNEMDWFDNVSCVGVLEYR